MRLTQIALFSNIMPLWLCLELESLDDIADILRNKTSEAKMMIICQYIPNISKTADNAFPWMAYIYDKKAQEYYNK